MSRIHFGSAALQIAPAWQAHRKPWLRGKPNQSPEVLTSETKDDCGVREQLSWIEIGLFMANVARFERAKLETWKRAMFAEIYFHPIT